MNDDGKRMDGGRGWLKTGLILAVAVAAVLVWAQIGRGQCCGGALAARTKSPAAKPTANKLPTLLDFGAEKCRPCQMLAPILAELEKEYAGVMNVRFVDVWKSENAAEARKWGIASIPVQVFLDKDGKELKRHVGFISKKDIMAEWKALGYEFKPTGEKK